MYGRLLTHRVVLRPVKVSIRLYILSATFVVLVHKLSIFLQITIEKFK